MSHHLEGIISQFDRIISSDLSENELFGLTDEHLAIVNQRREMHLAGESKSFSLEEVIVNARNSRF